MEYITYCKAQTQMIRLTKGKKMAKAAKSENPYIRKMVALAKTLKRLK